MSATKSPDFLTELDRFFADRAETTDGGMSERSKMMYYRAVLRRIAGNDPEANRQSADVLAMHALDRFGDL